MILSKRATPRPLTAFVDRIKIADLERRLVGARIVVGEAATVPTLRERSRLMAAMLTEMAAADGAELREVGTGIAQALRTALDRIVFHPDSIVAHFRDARIAHRFHWTIPRFEEALPSAKTVFDDGQKVPMNRPDGDGEDEPTRAPIPAAWLNRRRANPPKSVPTFPEGWH